MSNPPPRKIILIVSDGKAGHEQQSRALCAGMGFDCEVARVGYAGAWRKGLSYALDRVGVYWRGAFRMEGALPAGPFAAVAGTGSTAFYPARVLARKLGVPVIAILSPRGYRLGGFDCILSPAFDRLPQRRNVVATPVNVTQANEDFYARGIRDFEARHTRDPQKKAAGVIIGGNSKNAPMTAADMRAQLEAFFAATPGMTRWVTTSRRTPPEVEHVVREMDFDYRLLFSEDTFNPIPAFVMLCDTLCVTRDSTGMISEAVTHGAARVEILMTAGTPAPKSARFLHGLEAAGCIHCFDGQLRDARKKIDLRPIYQHAAQTAGLI